MKTLSEIIYYKQEEMTPSLQKFANWLWSNAESIFNKSMKTCAIEAGVSEPTVMRFCKFLNFSGFQNFRNSLQKEFSLSQWKPPFEKKSINKKTNNINNIKSITYEQTYQSLKELDKNLSDEILTKIISSLSKAKNIILLADQTAQHIASMFYQQSYIITDQVTFYNDKIMQQNTK